MQISLVMHSVYILSAGSMYENIETFKSPNKDERLVNCQFIYCCCAAETFLS